MKNVARFTNSLLLEYNRTITVFQVRGFFVNDIGNATSEMNFKIG